MFVLIFWTKYKSTSIVEEEALCPNVDEGKITQARYKDNKIYEAKILKKSCKLMR